MKKSLLCFLIQVFASGSAFALSEVELSGEVGIAASVWSLPTGERGNSAFSIPSLFVNMEVPLEDENLLVVRWDGSEEKDSSQERFSFKIREAYLDVISVFDGLHGLRFGLIPNVWQEAQYEVWSYRFLGSTAWAPTEKWKYLNVSDLGVSYMSILPNNIGEWAFSLINGEGVQAKESGPRKEATLFFRFNRDEDWAASFSYLYGSYDQYSVELGKKERLQALITYQLSKSLLLGLEYLKTQDPADAVRLYKMAESVDVTALAGQSIAGQGGSLFLILETGEHSEVMLRVDQLNPVEGQSGKELRTLLGAFSYQATEDLKFAVALDHTQFGDNFAPGARDSSKLEFATQVIF